MGRLLMWVVLLALLVMAGGAVWFMATTPDYAPQRVEKAVPRDSLGR